MATRVEETIELIRQGLRDEARANLEDTRNTGSGRLLNSIDVIVRNEDDFIIQFEDYGVFLNDGTQFIQGREFYSNLVEDPGEGEYEDEITEMLEEAFNQDVEQLSEDFDES